MLDSIRRFFKDKKGIAIEYGAIIAIIVVVVIGALGGPVRDSINAIFGDATDHVTDAFEKGVDEL